VYLSQLKYAILLSEARDQWKSETSIAFFSWYGPISC